jgi:hypothetical protein
MSRRGFGRRRIFQLSGLILRDGAEPVIGRAFARPVGKDEVLLETLMVRSAAALRVSNHEATTGDDPT